jgi:hypothetical protein
MVFAAHNLKSPHKIAGRNPFTGAKLLAWDYRNPSQPEPPDSSSYPAFSHFKQVSSRLLDTYVLGALVHAIDGSDEGKFAGQIAGQQLISSGEHEVFIMLIPRALFRPIAHLDSSTIDAVAERWTNPAPAGFFARLFRRRRRPLESQQIPLALRIRTLHEFHDLTSYAMGSERDLFLVQSP